MSRRAVSRHTAPVRAFCLLFLLLTTMGSQSRCDSRTPTLTCTTPEYTIRVGTRIPIDNPCDVGWFSQDGFTLCNPPAGLSVVTTRSRGIVSRELQAASTTPVGTRSVDFRYSQTDDFGLGTMTVTVDAGPQLTVTATPDTVSAGQSSQLGVAVTGGVPPYAYAWSPAASLDDSTSASPVATPAATTTYHVVVTDASSPVWTAQDSVTVHVNPAGARSACFTWSPPAPTAGNTVLLDAGCSNADGGTISTYRWWWDYSGNPSDPASLSVAFPVTEVIYQTPGDHPTRLQIQFSDGEMYEVVQAIPVIP